MGRLLPIPLSEKSPNVPGPGDSTLCGQSEPARRPGFRARQTHWLYFEPTLTTSCRRPLWRRRLRVFLPALVSIRARNPCLFFLFRFRGLYVGIMAIHLLATWLHSKISFQRYPQGPNRVNPGRFPSSWTFPWFITVKLTFPHSSDSLLSPKSGRFQIIRPPENSEGFGSRLVIIFVGRFRSTSFRGVQSGEHGADGFRTLVTHS